MRTIRPRGRVSNRQSVVFWTARPFAHSRGRRCWRRNFARCSNGTKVGTFTTWPTPSGCSRDLSRRRVVECLGLYLEKEGPSHFTGGGRRADVCEAAKPGLLTDLRPLLARAEGTGLTERTAREAFAKVYFAFIILLPGDSWAKTHEMKKRFGIDDS